MNQQHVGWDEIWPFLVWLAVFTPVILIVLFLLGQVAAWVHRLILILNAAPWSRPKMTVWVEHLIWRFNAAPWGRPTAEDVWFAMKGGGKLFLDGEMVTDVGSWRGNDDMLYLDTDPLGKPVRQYLFDVGMIHEGYTGGQFPVKWNTLMWKDSYGESDGPPVLAMRVVGDEVHLTTNPVSWRDE